MGVRLATLGVLSLAIVVGETAGQSGGDTLPHRPTERPLMTTSVPHIQVDVTPRISVHDQLFRSVFSLPDVENLPAGVVGARTIWLPDTVLRAQRDRGNNGRPAAADGVGHIHADGSLHVSLPEDRIRAVVNARWGARHPSIDGYAMLFTPQSMSELAVTFQLVLEAYNRATGRTLLAPDYFPADVPRLSEPPVELAWVGLIRSRGHFPRGGYDVHDGQQHEAKTTATTIHGGVPDGCRSAGARRGQDGRAGGAGARPDRVGLAQLGGPGARRPDEGSHGIDNRRT
jgi:hypothetical protein